MKNVALLLVAYIILTSSSCDKDIVDPRTQSWKLDTTTYTIDTIARSGKLFYASGPVGLLTFEFAILPTGKDTYTVGDPQASDRNISIQARTGEEYSSMSGTVYVAVTGNGKISIDATDVRMIHMPLGADSVKLTAHLTEP